MGFGFLLLVFSRANPERVPACLCALAGLGNANRIFKFPQAGTLAARRIRAGGMASAGRKFPAGGSGVQFGEDVAQGLAFAQFLKRDFGMAFGVAVADDHRYVLANAFGT